MNLTEYDPTLIPYQLEAIRIVKKEYNYSLGPLKLLLSGAIGSGKTTILAHLLARHLLEYPNATVGIGRLSLKYLKDTLFAQVVEQLGNLVPLRIEQSMGRITLPNGSKLISFSWADKKYKKVRSYEFSAFAIEELTETNTKEMYEEIYSRLGRVQHIKECWLACATNPDEPDHWVYEEFMENPEVNKIVLYSKTKDNKILPEFYEQNLRKTYDPLMARRMLDGEWLSILEDVIYYCYDDSLNVIEKIKLDQREAIWISLDFNIGVGKPMSSCAGQHINGKIAIFDEVILKGMRTLDVMEEYNARGYFSGRYKIIITGDATGSHRDTRGVGSDWDIIKNYLSNLNAPVAQLQWSVSVGRSNPPIRTRHNLVNAYCLNDTGNRRLKITKNCTTLRKGMLHTKLKSGSTFMEDDSFHAQHVTTALGYMIYQMDKGFNKKKITMGNRRR